jgi:molybdopterin synthase sulfur carrier subunit
MSVTVRVPTILRSYTSGEAKVTVDGAVLSDVLESLDGSFPGIKGRIVDEQGELRRFVNVYVGNEDVRFLEGLATPVEDGSEISIIPAVAGG